MKIGKIEFTPDKIITMVFMVLIWAAVIVLWWEWPQVQECKQFCIANAQNICETYNTTGKTSELYKKLSTTDIINSDPQ